MYLETGKGAIHLGCGPKNLSLDNHSFGGTLSNGHILSATALQFSSTGNSRFYKCNTDRCNEESPSNYYKTTFEGVFLVIVGTVGLLGNILTMIVLTRRSMRSSINLIFTGDLNHAFPICSLAHSLCFYILLKLVLFSRTKPWFKN